MGVTQGTLRGQNGETCGEGKNDRNSPESKEQPGLACASGMTPPWSCPWQKRWHVGLDSSVGDDDSRPGKPFLWGPGIPSRVASTPLPSKRTRTESVFELPLLLQYHVSENSSGGSLPFLSPCLWAGGCVQWKICDSSVTLPSREPMVPLGTASAPKGIIIKNDFSV